MLGEFPSAISRYLVSNVTKQGWHIMSLRFPSAISRYLVSNEGLNHYAALTILEFPSAISRYLVSNVVTTQREQREVMGFHPLYRGTWFPTEYWKEVEKYENRTFPSAISRYLVSNTLTTISCVDVVSVFPSAISRYLVSDFFEGNFLPSSSRVSIRYIAVLGI